MAEALHSYATDGGSVYERDPRSVEDLRAALRDLQKYGITYAQVAEATGINRSTISLFVNKGDLMS